MLAERVAVIQVANGYQTDAGVLVVLGEAPQLGPDDPDTAIAIVPGEEQTRWVREHVFVRLPIDVQAVVKSDLTNLATAWWTVEQVIADIKRAVETSDRMLDRLLPPPGLERALTRALQREPGLTTIGAAVTYLTEFGEVWGDP